MTDKAAETNPKNGPGFATAATPKQLMEQLVSMMGQDAPGSESGLEAKVEQLESKLDSVLARLDSGEGAASSGAQFDADLAEKLKKLMLSILVESGFLEKFISSTVRKALTENSSLQKEVQQTIRKEFTSYLSGEEMKMLLDDKFRAVTLYLKTDVIPSAVRHAMRNATPQPG